MNKFKAITKEELNKLPATIVEKVKNTLKAFNECSIEYEHGEYHTTSACLRSYYADDYKFIGTAYQEDIYTIEERIENYRNEFHCEPYYLLNQIKNK